MERLLEDVSFHAARRTGETITIDAAFVDERLAGIARTTTWRSTSSSAPPAASRPGTSWGAPTCRQRLA